MRVAYNYTVNNQMKATMSKHNYVPPVAPQESKIQEVIIIVTCLAVFALWGVLLALGV